MSNQSEYKTGYNNSEARPQAYTHAIGQGDNTKMVDIVKDNVG